MTEVVLVIATTEHVQAIAANAREADIAELWAQARVTPAAAMARGLECGVFAVTALFDGEPACMFGVTPASALGGIGVPWMIASHLVERSPATFLRRCRPVVAYMRELFPTQLTNAVDARNTATINWLRWLGFQILPARPMGPDSLPFHPFEMKAHV